ncbi:galanin receptor 2a isoform X2 [Nematostella vectensis]|uniref:galanin receptor 2a isoform X2 n=1 Tax=Nematostella vectensis TaxID=45351 RepID=UPI001390590D|nr:galanin receptor 2a isoform X2 [Nematostella vectensis]XP_032220744.1 galanin receptor 2a isoform X2 [Nematostella vectensis]XP_032220745.1 galanin receptor 2a isoform X2 [Nematostella vectensis]XP_032220746.1 galanin receptor 2a isoform X2 [Nematostella vectensis]XP_032220747.1 galanin receptor 2a isoform X2 [Nematostella vectensis]XP_032220748.1 galanin receptor 2a isoform X2 [Nematostella vectensis]XP_032220749.1 galanin receptor 2a isoform X2 [Nematostella vectensis]XP_032220750.1 gal
MMTENVNFSGGSDNGTEGSLEMPHVIQAVMTTAYALSFVVGLLGNGLGLFIIFKRSSKGNASTNVLIGNMALADLLVTLFAMPHSVGFLYYQNKWIGGIIGEIGCKLAQFPFVVSIAASILTLLAISVERFWAIYYPLRARKLRKPKVLSSVIWLLAISVFCPYLFSYTVKRTASGQYYCVVEWGDIEETYRTQRLYYLMIFVFLYALPLLVITLLYTLIGVKLWYRKQPGQENARSRRTAIVAKRRILRLLIVLVLVFTVCWLPAHLMHYYMYYDLKAWFNIPVAVKLLSFWICHSNSAINPGIYILLSENFRREFLKTTLGLVCSKAPSLPRTSSSKSRKTGRKATLSSRLFGSRRGGRTVTFV